MEPSEVFVKMERPFCLLDEDNFQTQSGTHTELEILQDGGQVKLERLDGDPEEEQDSLRIKASMDVAIAEDNELGVKVYTLGFSENGCTEILVESDSEEVPRSEEAEVDPLECTEEDYQTLGASHTLNPASRNLYKNAECDNQCGTNRVITVQIETIISKESFNCIVCDYQATTKSNLLIHMQTHAGLNPYNCSVCDYRTSHKSYLLKHMRTHKEEIFYKCSECDFQATRNGPLLLHMRIHTGEKPYKCSICDFQTAYKTYLSSHMRTHTRERPYKCSECDYRAILRSTFVSHMRSHSEKPHQCDACGNRFRSRIRLLAHMRSHIGEKPYKYKRLTSET